MTIAVVERPRSRTATLLKASAILLALGIGITTFRQHYFIGIMTTTQRCIDNATVVLVDKDDKTPVRGVTMAFLSRDLSPIIEDGKVIIKFVDGMPGDSVDVGVDHTSVNGVDVVGDLRPVADELGVAPQRFVRSQVLGANQYWMHGRTRESFDSRYWGPIKGDQIVGRAYILF